MCVESDTALLQRARRGDEDAFSELFARHRRPVFRYAMYMSGQEMADDVVQDTFLAVFSPGHPAVDASARDQNPLASRIGCSYK